MAEFTITLEGDALEELEEIVADILRNQPSHAIKTPADWLQNYCQAHLEARAKQQLINHAASLTEEDLKSKLGVARIKDIRKNG